MAYDKSGRAPDGSLDPTRRLVAGIMHMAAIGGGAKNLRQIGDDLYQTMVTGESHGGWKIKTPKGGDSKDDDAGTDSGSKIKKGDVDFGMGRRAASLSEKYRPKVTPTMKEGGLVRGAGCAQRGRGRGKMV